MQQTPGMTPCFNLAVDTTAAAWRMKKSSCSLGPAKVASRIVMIAALSLAAGCASLTGRPVSPASGLQASTGTAITIFAAGDTADCRKVNPANIGAAHTAALIASSFDADPNTIVLTLGDNTYPVGKLAEFTDCYAPTWGKFKARTLPAPGNHEYYTAGAPGYFGYFGTQAGPGQRGYFSRDVGGWHIVSLNSNLKPPASDAQLAWLAEDLAALRKRHATGCLLAFWHHPLYSSGGHGNNLHMRPVWEALLAAHADVVLSAHDHDYERFAPLDGNGRLDVHAGIRSFVVGTGGAKLTPFTATKLHSEVQDNSTHGVLKMVLHPAGYDWAFLPVDGAVPRDAGNGQCHE